MLKAFGKGLLRVLCHQRAVPVADKAGVAGASLPEASPQEPGNGHPVTLGEQVAETDVHSRRGEGGRTVPAVKRVAAWNSSLRLKSLSLMPLSCRSKSSGTMVSETIDAVADLQK